MKKIIILILVFLLLVTPFTISCENLNELQCRRSKECTPIYNEHFLVFSYDYKDCIEGAPVKRNYVNEITGFVFSFINDNFKTTAAEVDIEKEQEDEAQRVVYGEEKTVYIYAGSKLLAKIKDV